jgi:hypothetical protein
MKIIEVIQIDEGLWQMAKNNLRDAGSWGMEKIAAAFGRGDTWRKAEAIAPEIADLERRSGRKLTRDQIEKHIIESDPAVRNALDEAVRMKQAYIDNQYAINPVAARQVFGSAQAPVARLTQQEKDLLLSKPEFKPKEKLVKEVESKVSEAMSKERRAAAMAAAAPVVRWTDRLLRYGVEAAIVAQVLAPFSEYYAKVQRAKEYYDAGQMPTAGVPASIKTLADWYIWYTDKALGDAILKSGGLFAAAYIARPVFRWLGKIAKVFVGETAGTYIGNLVGSAATAGILAWGFDEGADKFWGSTFANLIDIPQFHLDLSRVVGSAITTRVGDDTQSISSDIMWGVDAVASKFRELTGLKNGSDAFVDKANGKETDAGKKPAGQPATPPASTTPGGATVSGDWN